MNKKLSITLGIIDISQIYFLFLTFITNLYQLIIPVRAGNHIPSYFLIDPILQVVLIISIVVSAVFYFLNKKVAYIMYFPQLAFRIYFRMPTIAFLLTIAEKNFDDNLYEYFLIICGALEVVRLAVTIRTLIVNKKR